MTWTDLQKWLWSEFVTQHAGSARGGLTIQVDARGATDPAAVEAAVRRAVIESVAIADARTDAKLGSYMRPSMA